MKMYGPFKSGTGLLGATEEGQHVDEYNIQHIPPGSVIKDWTTGSRIIHLHDGLWLYITDCSWCYDRVDRMKNYLTPTCTVEHLP